MPRRVTLHVSVAGEHDLREQVVRQIRLVILEGRLQAGEALPSTRELAEQLGVSRTTIGAAYDRLMAEGLVRGRPGAGTFVTGGLETSPATPADRPSPLQPTPLWSTVVDLSVDGPEPCAFDFRPGVPDPRLFPFATWRALASHHTNVRTTLTGLPSNSGGHPRLRAALARHLGVSGSIRAAAVDVFVTRGAQQAIELAARVLLEPGDLVAVEEPGHRDIRALFESIGCRVVGVPVDAEGMVVEAIPAGVRCLHVCPARHFPLGMTMSIGRRRALLDWAVAADGVIIEDAYDGEFRYAGRPIDPLHVLDRHGRVVHVGTLSRVMLPDVNVGYLIAPAPLHAALHKASRVIDPGVAAAGHLAVATFIEEGRLARHIRRMRSVYAERRRRISGFVRGALSENVAVLPSTSGLDVAVRFHDDGIDDAEVAREARRHGARVVAFSTVATSDRHRGLLLGFGALPTDAIEDGLAVVRRAVEGSAPARHDPVKTPKA